MTGEVERADGATRTARPMKLAPHRPIAGPERIPPRAGSTTAEHNPPRAQEVSARERIASRVGSAAASECPSPHAGAASESESVSSHVGPASAQGSRARYVSAPTSPRRDVSWGDLWSDLVVPPSLPPQYGDVRKIARDPEARRHSDAWLFCEQGRALADVEDDCPYAGTFERYYPTYNAMTDRQLRGYITWRTQLRRGIVTKTSTSFAFVYIYELLNGIGVKGPQDAYRRLRRFWDDYRDLESAADRYLRLWLRDYVVYHGLPRELITDDPTLSKEVILDKALVIVRDAAAHASDQRFAAWATLSSYRIRSSRFYKDFSADVQAVVLGVMGRLEAHYAKAGRKHDLFETVLGDRVALPYEMFRSCVLYEEEPHPDVVYELDAVNRYACTRGHWTCERHMGNRRESAWLGSVLKEIDARMRLRYGYAHPLREEKAPKYLLGFIEKEIDARLAWKKAHAPRIIEIDRSKLGGIRGDAATVCEELLIDEERGEEAVGLGVAGGGRGVGPRGAVADGDGRTDRMGAVRGGDGGSLSTAADDCSQLITARPTATTLADAVLAGPTGPKADGGAPAVSASPERHGDAAVSRVDSRASGDFAPNPAGLTDQEATFVRGLLAGDGSLPPGPVASLDMLVDAVNEKLLDVLGDTAVEFDADGRPAIIEDYADDVRGIVGA